MSIVYDNWEKLVEAVLKREELKRIALCPSFSSSSSADISSRSSNSFHVNSDVVPVGNYVTRAVERGVAARAALIFAYFRRRKPHDHFSYFRRRKPHAHFSYFRRRKPHVHFSDALAEGGPYHLRQLERFSLRELKVATDNFIDRNILGIGDFGKVYKGRLANGSLVAVKRLMKERTPDRELQFKREVEMIPMLAHGNIRRLHGFCWTPKEMLLVYPYMANGSVASCLRGYSVIIGQKIMGDV